MRSRAWWCLGAFAGAAAVMGFAACSSVPDLRFVDDDAGADGGADARVDQAAPVPTTICAAPGGPPANVVCCGATPCVGCAPEDCASCLGRCGGEACCKRGQIRCDAVQNCL